MNWYIQLLNQTTNIFKLGCGILDNQRIGTLIHNYRAALTQQRSCLAASTADQSLEFAGICIVDADIFGAQRSERLNFFLAFQLKLFAGGDLICRRNQQHIAHLTLVQPLRFQNQLQSLVPRHILQTQSNTAIHRIGSHQIQTGEVCNQLQHRADINVLEIERELLAGILKCIFTLTISIGLGHRLNVDTELRVRLVRQILPGSSRNNFNQRTTIGGLGFNHGHRRGKVRYIQLANQVIFHPCADKTRNDAATFFADIDRD